MKILLIQPSISPPGGGNGVAAWMLQSLKDLHDVTVLTWEPVDLDRINDFYGTTLRQTDFRSRLMPPWRHALRLTRASTMAQVPLS